MLWRSHFVFSSVRIDFFGHSTARLAKCNAKQNCLSLISISSLWIVFGCIWIFNFIFTFLFNSVVGHCCFPFNLRLAQFIPIGLDQWISVSAVPWKHLSTITNSFRTVLWFHHHHLLYTHSHQSMAPFALSLSLCAKHRQTKQWKIKQIRDK